MSSVLFEIVCESFRIGDDRKNLVSSPTPGLSTLMTSAPRSPRIIVANGPASTRLRSRILQMESLGLGSYRWRV